MRILRSSTFGENTKLYRYISFRHFMDFVETKQTSLSRIKNWDDTWEIPSSRLPIKHDDGSIKNSLWNIGDSMFGQCWSLHEESDAMWRIYSPQKEGVVMQTSVDKFQLLKGVRIAALGHVTYYDDLKKALDQSHTQRDIYERFTDAFLKRRAFEHEKEVRFVTVGDSQCMENPPTSEVERCYLDLNPLEFIEGITIDPRADERYVEVLQKFCERAKFKIRPMKSALYGDLQKLTRLVRQYVPVKK